MSLLGKLASSEVYGLKPFLVVVMLNLSNVCGFNLLPEIASLVLSIDEALRACLPSIPMKPVPTSMLFLLVHGPPPLVSLCYGV